MNVTLQNSVGSIIPIHCDFLRTCIALPLSAVRAAVSWSRASSCWYMPHSLRLQVPQGGVSGSAASGTLGDLMRTAMQDSFVLLPNFEVCAGLTHAVARTCILVPDVPPTGVLRELLPDVVHVHSPGRALADRGPRAPACGRRRPASEPEGARAAASADTSRRKTGWQAIVSSLCTESLYGKLCGKRQAKRTKATRSAEVAPGAKYDAEESINPV